MTTSGIELRVLIYLATLADASVVSEVVREAGHLAHPCPTFQELCLAMNEGAGAAVVALETLDADSLAELAQQIAAQPEWSDFPLILITKTNRGGGLASMLATSTALGNVVILQRPLRLATLVTSLKASLRARQRQYEMRNSHELLRDSEQRLRQVFDSTVDLAILTLDEQARVASWNSAARRVKGYEAHQILGQHVSRFYTDEDKSVGKPGTLLNQAVTTGVAHDEGWRLQHDGSRFWADVTINALRNADASLRGFSVFVRDFSERRNAAAERSQLIAELEQKNRQLADSLTDLEQFSFAVSHDLQEPLRTLRCFATLLEKQFGATIREAGAADYVKFISSAAVRMQAMINGFLRYSRAGHGAVFALIDLQEAVDWARENLSLAIEDSHAEIVTAGLPLVVGDFQQLSHVLQNLIGNALKYRGSERPRIVISAERGELDWTIAVQDNGLGIEPEFHARIFQLFQRVNPAAEVSGTGVGLSIAQRVIQRHGGRMWVESEPSNGSTFYFTLPHRQLQSAQPQTA